MNKHIEDAMEIRNEQPMVCNCAQTILRVYAKELGLSPEQADVLAERMLFIYQGGVLRARISGDTGYLQRLKSAMKDTFTQYRALCCAETGGSI